MPALPNAHRAHIDEAKITNYLLSPTHPRGSAKARFFGSFGFAAANPDELEVALLDHVVDHRASHVEQTPFGHLYEVIGPVASPDGRNPIIRVIWIVRAGEDFPRLVTAIPVEPEQP